MHPRMRVSDADRRRTVAALENHTAAGRLDLEEFSDRASHAWKARTVADLRMLTEDLPVAHVPARPDRRQAVAPMLVVLGAILAPLGLLGVLSVLAGGSSMMAGFAAMCGMG